MIRYPENDWPEVGVTVCKCGHLADYDLTTFGVHCRFCGGDDEMELTRLSDDETEIPF